MSRLSCSFSGVEPQSPVRVILKDGPYPSYEVMRQKLVVSAGGHPRNAFHRHTTSTISKSFSRINRLSQDTVHCN